MRLHESLRGTINGALTWALVAGLGLLVTLPPVGAAQQLGALPQLESGREMGGIIDRVLVRIDGRAILYSDFETQWGDQLTAISSPVSYTHLTLPTIYSV